MALQVRLRHPLGDRLIELEPRPVQQPVVVGRIAGADVQIPSAAVALKHAILFVHQGRWAVQDAAGGKGTGTYVNGRRIAGAAFLKVGDVVTLGPDGKAASVEIDPDGPAEGRTGYVVADGGAGGAAPTGSSPVRPVVSPHGYPSAPPQPVAGPGVARPVYAQGVPVAAPVQPPPADGDTIAWPATDTPDAAKVPNYATPRRRQTSSGGPVLIALVVGGVVTGGLVYFVLKDKSQPVAAPSSPTKPTAIAGTPTSKAAPVPTAAEASNNIFGIPDQDPTRRKGSSIAGGAGTPVTANAIEVLGSAGIGRKVESSIKDASAFTHGGNGAGAAAAAAAAELSPSDQAAEVLASKDDPQMKTPEWEGITTAYYRDPLGALMRMDDYEQLRPNVLTAQLNTLRDGVLDRLWFERIAQLWRQRDGLAKELAQVDQALVDETNDSYKQNTIIPKKKALQDKFNGVADTLEKEMGYNAPKPPSLHDDLDLARLRRYRNPDYYKKWKTGVLNSVHRRHTLPFEWQGS